MKALHFFASAVAIAMLSACSSSDEPAADASATGGETGYLAVNLVNANNGGRADDPTEADFVDGTDDENKITNCRLYFFDNSGAAVKVYSSAEGGALAHNYLDLNLDNENANTNTGDFNVEKIFGATVVLKSTETSTFPDQVMAVANMDFDDCLGTDDLSRSDLVAKVLDLSLEAGHPMASSVYSNGEAIVYSTPIGDKIATTEANAIANPVDIYIERSLARVDITKPESQTSWKYTLTDEDELNVVIMGWAVVNNPHNSYIVKNLNEAWVATAPFTGWNSADLYRSFWAEMPDDYGEMNLETFNGIKDMGEPSDENKTTYTTENTLDDAGQVGTAADLNSQIIFACQLQDKNGYPAPYYHYMGQNLGDEAKVKTAIAATFRGKYYIKSEGTDGSDIYTTIGPDLLELVSAHDLSYSDLLDYHVVAQIENKNLEIYDDSQTKVNNDDVNADLAKYPAEIAKDGYVYYFADIKHLGNKIGVVRNHVYQIEVESFKGLGTPVYDPTQVIIPTNVVDAETYVAARIKVHSWRIVNNKYNFGN